MKSFAFYGKEQMTNTEWDKSTTDLPNLDCFETVKPIYKTNLAIISAFPST